MTKICTKCKIEKPFVEFHKRGDYKDKLKSHCKKCSLAYNRSLLKSNPIYREKGNKMNREWHEKNKEYSRQIHREYFIKNPNYQKESNLKRKYGITLDEYNLMFEKQGGRCSICKTDTPGGQWNSFHVDHDHSTGEVRGLLCNSCNLGLGKFKDNIDILKRALGYLESYNNVPMQPAH